MTDVQKSGNLIPKFKVFDACDLPLVVNNNLDNGDQSKDDDDNTDEEDNLNSSNNAFLIQNDNFDLDLCKIFAYIEQGGDDGLKNLKSLLNSKVIDVNDGSSYWTTPLGYAIFMREEEIAIYLINMGADVNLEDNSGLLPIHFAVGIFDYIQLIGKNRKNKELKRLIVTLILKGSKLGVKSSFTDNYPSNEALLNNYIFSHNQIINRRKSIVANKHFLVNEYKEIEGWINEEDMLIKSNFERKDGYLKFVELIRLNENKAIKYLNENKRYCNQIDSKGNSPLHYAIFLNRRKLVEVLISLGADHERKNIDGKTPRDYTFIPGNKKAVSMRDHHDYLIELRNKKFNKAWTQIFNNICEEEEKKQDDQKRIEDLKEKEKLKLEKLNKKKQARKEKEIADKIAEEKREAEMKEKIDNENRIREENKRLEKLKNDEKRRKDEENKRLEKLKNDEKRRKEDEDRIIQKKLKIEESMKKKAEKKRLKKEENEKKQKEEKERIQKEEEYVRESIVGLESYYTENEIEIEMRNRALDLLYKYENNNKMDELPSGKKVPIVIIGS